ncbi:MAG TPA: polyphosphate kinase 1 [Bacteroidales bacterium]|nr:polyphosphate kinase 1 [Bacteroidales bacterium]HQD59380.1 polyphosphate kinase 1 [Bacteroidales bacterium]
MYNKNHFVNRELSWLDFNERVLQEAESLDNPLIERIRFLGIYSNNLDEFYRVRYATLTRLVKVKGKKNKYSKYFKPQEIIEKINIRVKKLQERQDNIFENIIKELENHQIYLLRETDMTEQIHIDFITNYFNEILRPNIYPIMLHSLRPYGVFKDSSVYLAVHMQYLLGTNKNKKKENFALIEIPDSIERIIVLPEINGSKYIMFVDDIVRYFLSKIFKFLHYDHFTAYALKMTRDAELNIDNDISKSLMELIAEKIDERERGIPVRMVVDECIPDKLLSLVLKKFNIDKKATIVKGQRYHNMRDLMEFPDLGLENLVYQPLEMIPHKTFSQSKSLLETLKKRDQFISFPYQSFYNLLDILREASIDPKVKSIKITIYRTGRNSSVMNALINAARNGKKVTVFLELQARFDEENNIYWSNLLQKEGIKVIHSDPGIKVHCKLLLIKRLENEKLIYYAGLNTGNFNLYTSKVYTDFIILTRDSVIAEDVNNIFELLELNFKIPDFNKIIVSPFYMRDFVHHQLDNLINSCNNGYPANAIIKLNHIVDEEIIEHIYMAAKIGVKFNFIIRTTCCLKPIYPTIKIRSIVGRFLEHARILYFDFAKNKDELYLSSADWMPRNMDHRIEVTYPILDKNIKQVLIDILQLQLKDNVKARHVNNEFNNQIITNDYQTLNSQMAIYEYLKQYFFNS